MNNLKEYRERLGLSQQQLSAMSGVNRGLISQLEIGIKKLTKKMANRLSPVLHVAPDDLIGGDAIKYQESLTSSLKAILAVYYEDFANNKLTVSENDLYEILSSLMKKTVDINQISAVKSICIEMTKEKR